MKGIYIQIFNTLPNGLGWGATFAAIAYNLLAWLEEVNFNGFLTIILSFLSILYLILRLYDKYLDIKNKRKELEKTENDEL